MIESAEKFYQLRTSENRDEYERAAYDEAPLNIWLEVIEKYPNMRQWVAQNKTVPIEVLDILSKDSNSEVRAMVAMKRKLPEHLQMELAKDEDYSVRNRLAWNAKVTKAALMILAEDRESEIQRKARERLAKGEHV